MNDLTVADKLNLALIETPEQGAKFVKVFKAAVGAARCVGADREVTNKYAEKLVRSVRVTGALIAELPRAQRGRKKNGAEKGETHFLNFCREAEISDRTAKNWQLVSAIPEPEFEQRIAEIRDTPDPNVIITLSAFYAKQRNSFTGEVEWYTPTQYIEAARKLMGGIDLDPATSEAAQKTVRAKHYYIKSENGLDKKWTGRVWLNPPYGEAIAAFVHKLVESVRDSEISEAVLLTHNSADTTWWHEAADACAAVCLTRGRINFQRSDGFTASPPLGQSFFYFGKRPKSFSTRFSDFGKVFYP